MGGVGFWVRVRGGGGDVPMRPPLSWSNISGGSQVHAGEAKRAGHGPCMLVWCSVAAAAEPPPPAAAKPHCMAYMPQRYKQVCQEKMAPTQRRTACRGVTYGVPQLAPYLGWPPAREIPPPPTTTTQPHKAVSGQANAAPPPHTQPGPAAPSLTQ